MSDRVYWPDSASFADGASALVISGEEGHHLGRVRRVKVGAVVEVFDGRGFARQAEVIDVVKDRVTLRPFGPPLPDRASPLALTLATAVPKGDRFDWLVEKATELGVNTLVPILTERSVVDPRGAKLDRLRRVVVEAAKQCGRNHFMMIGHPTPWSDLVRDAPPNALRLVAHPGGLTFCGWPRPSVSAVVAVGPEGGFTEDEIKAAVSARWVSVSLGATRLRVETAALTVAARVLALTESATPYQTSEGGQET